MNRDAPRWRGALWWAVPVAALVLLLALETDWGRRLHRLPEPPPTIEPKPVSSALLPEYQVEGGLAGHAETVNRTLFNPTRRPAPVAAGDGRRQMQRGQFLLTGTAVAGERNIAFLKEISGGKARSVRQGEQINGLLVADVRPDRVRLTLGDEFEELFLKVAPGPKTTTAPPPFPPAGAAPPGGAAGAPAAAPPGAAGPAPAAEPSPAARRAAVAAAAAAAGAAQQQAPPGGASNAGNAAIQTAPGPNAAPASQPASADPAWNEVYERMRQRNPQPNQPAAK
jgi:hypothetical protein